MSAAGRAGAATPPGSAGPPGASTQPDAAAPPGEAGSERQLAWLYAPPEARADVAALFVLEAEIAAGSRPGIEHSVAHARLAWWLEEATSLAAGRPRHPLGRRLAASFAQLGLSPPDLRGLVENARLDLACSAFESGPEYAEYLGAWGRGLFRNLALRLAPGAAARAEVERFSSVAGPAVRDVELVTRLAQDARLGRVHVPLTAARAGEPAEHEAWQRQPWPPAQSEALRERLGTRRAALQRAAAALPAAARPPLRALLAWAALAGRRAGQCVESLPLQYHAGRFEPLAAAWAAWRAAVAAARGHLPAALQEHR
jgi:phytoene synthase